MLRLFCLHFQAFCDLCCCVQSCAGGDSYQDTFLMSDEAAGGKCLIGSNGKDLIINAGIQNGRNESCADTCNL